MTQEKKSNDLIFRKQSLWLLLASLLSAGVFVFDLYRADGIDPLRVANHYPALLLAVVMVALPFITIFMYRDRKRQVRMTAMSMLSCSVFVSYTLSRVTRLSDNVPAPTNGIYWIGSVIPLAAMIFLIMALLRIRHDDKLVRSMDRLR